MSAAQIPNAPAEGRGSSDAEDHPPHASALRAPSLLDFMPRQLQTKKKRRTKADAKEPGSDEPPSSPALGDAGPSQPELPIEAAEAAHPQVHAGGLDNGGLQADVPSLGPAMSQILAAGSSEAPATANAATLPDLVAAAATSTAEAEAASSGRVASAPSGPAHADVVPANLLARSQQCDGMQPKTVRLPYRSYAAAMGLSTPKSPAMASSSPAEASNISADTPLVGADRNPPNAPGSSIDSLQDIQLGRGRQSLEALPSAPLPRVNLVEAAAAQTGEPARSNGSEAAGQVLERELDVQPWHNAAVPPPGGDAPIDDGHGWVDGQGEGSTHHLGDPQPVNATSLHAVPAADPWGAHLGGLLSEVRVRNSAAAAASDLGAARHPSMHLQMPLPRPSLPAPHAATVTSHDAHGQPETLPEGPVELDNHRRLQPSLDDFRQGTTSLASLPRAESGSQWLHGAQHQQEGLSPQQNNGGCQQHGLGHHHDSVRGQQTSAMQQQASPRVYPQSRLPWRGAGLRLASRPTDAEANTEQSHLPASVQHALAQTQMRPPASSQIPEPARIADSLHGPVPFRSHPAPYSMGNNGPEDLPQGSLSSRLAHYSSQMQRHTPPPSYPQPSAAMGPPSQPMAPHASLPARGGIAELPHHQQVPQLTALGPSPANPASVNYVLQRMGAQVQATNGVADAQTPLHVMDRQGNAHPAPLPSSSSSSLPLWHQAASPSAQIRNLEASRYQQQASSSQVTRMHADRAFSQQQSMQGRETNNLGSSQHENWQQQQQQRPWQHYGQNGHAHGNMHHSASVRPGLRQHQPEPSWQDGHSISSMAQPQAATSAAAGNRQQQAADRRPGMPRPGIPTAVWNQPRLQQIDRAASHQMQPVSHFDLSSQAAALHAVHDLKPAGLPCQDLPLSRSRSQGSDVTQSAAVQPHHSPASHVHPAIHYGGTAASCQPTFAAQASVAASSQANEWRPNDSPQSRSSARQTSTARYAASTNGQSRCDGLACTTPAPSDVLSRELSPFEPHAPSGPCSGANSTTMSWHPGSAVRIDAEISRPESQAQQSPGSFSMAAFFPPALSPAKPPPHRQPDHF